MKTRFAATLLAALVLISGCLSGCSTQPAETPTSPTEPEKPTLSVYMVDTDALFVDAVYSFRKQRQDITLDVTSFTTCQAMLDAVKETAPTGGGPDVLLCNSNSLQGEVDGYTLAKSGMFLPLDRFAAQLDPAVYPKVLLDAGSIAGAQYFLPLSYNLLYAYTSQRLMTIKGYSPAEDLYRMLLKESESLTDVSHKSPISMQVFRPDPVNAFFEAAGITFFDKNTGEITADKEEVEEICRFVKLVYDNREKTAALTQKFTSDFSGATASFSFFTENYAFMNGIRYYQSLFPAKTGSPMVAMPYHKRNDPQALCASIVCFGGINAKTKAPEQAFELLKFLLDYHVQTDWARGQLTYEYHAPVSLAAYQTAVEQLSSNAGTGGTEIAPLNPQNAALLMANTQKITDAVIANTTLGVRLEEVFTPYFLGQDSFDNCYDLFLRELQQYLGQ
ncbi:MAG: extracellular solute-binding protein [Clostridia bacterium]|nr:extracellular solute-binding protein [Clostridia bacterium]